VAQINVDVNGRPYAVGCEDGQEPHLVELARIFDQQVRQISRDMGQLGDTRLFLMGALLLADELYDVRNQLAGLQAEVSRLETERSGIERRAVSALEAAAVRIERLGSADV